MRSIVLGIAVVAWAALAAAVSTVRAQDIYEPDDVPPQARVIVIDDADAQRHDFSKPSDADWVKFYALAGQDYEISVRNAGPACDAVIELYGPDGAHLLDIRDDSPAGGQERLPFAPASDGLAYVKVRGYDGTVYGDGTGYDLRVFRPIGPPVPGILTGRVYEATTGAPLENAVLRTSSGGSAISSDTGLYLLRDFEQDVTISASAEGFRPFSAGITIPPAEVTTLDIPLALDPSSGCSARLYGDLSLLIPRIALADTLLWATMKYDASRQDKVVFEIMGAGFITDTAGPPGCNPASLGGNLRLDLPAISFGGMVLRASLDLDSIAGTRVFFSVTSAEILSAPAP